MKQATDPISITLQAQQWNVVLGALMEAPWRIADPMIREITRQAEAEGAAIAAPPQPARPTNGDARPDGEDHTAPP